MIDSISSGSFASFLKQDTKEPVRGGGDETTGQGEQRAGTVELVDIVEVAGEYEVYFFS
jgi:hypothetical protein